MASKSRQTGKVEVENCWAIGGLNDINSILVSYGTPYMGYEEDSTSLK